MTSMASWEEELSSILDSMGVSQGTELDSEPPIPESLHELDQKSELFLDTEEMSIVRHEVEATVMQVVRLVQSGKLERALKDDVMLVLRALSRPLVDEEGVVDGEYASAAAMLRFCRIVLKLTNSVAHE